MQFILYSTCWLGSVVPQVMGDAGLWRNGSASDSRSEGWAFESLWAHVFS